MRRAEDETRPWRRYGDGVSAFRDLRARAAALDARVVDGITAAAVAVLGGIELAVAAWGEPAGTLALGTAAVLASAIAMGIRRIQPIGAAIAAFGLLPFAQQNTALYELNVPFVVLFAIPYSVARHTDGRAMRIGFAVLLALVAGTVASDPSDEDPSGSVIFGTVAVLGAPWLIGRLLRSRALLADTLAEKAAAAERRREAVAEQAVEAERTRIAGELHDVVSHALSAMVVGAGAAKAFSRRDADKAAVAFAGVEETGREALGELRRLLGILRHGDEELGLAPQPSLAHVHDLARRAAREGLPVHVSVEGEPPASLPAGVDLTAYRLVQAALTAASAEGGAGRAEVTVRYAPDAVEVGIEDDGALRGDGSLVGLRERVLLYGGELRSAPRLRGGHRVRARLPLEGVPA